MLTSRGGPQCHGPTPPAAQFAKLRMQRQRSTALAHSCTSHHSGCNSRNTYCTLNNVDRCECSVRDWSDEANVFRPQNLKGCLGRCLTAMLAGRLQRPQDNMSSHILKTQNCHSDVIGSLWRMCHSSLDSLSLASLSLAYLRFTYLSFA